MLDRNRSVGGGERGRQTVKNILKSIIIILITSIFVSINNDNI